LTNNFKIFVPHYTKLTERKKDITQMFLINGIKDYHIFEEYDKEDILQEDFFHEETEIRKRIQKFIPEQQINYIVKNTISDAQKSLALKHKYIYKKFLETSTNQDYLIVLEDDAIIVNNFINIIDSITKKIEFDCINFGAGATVKDVNKIIKDANSIKFSRDPIHPFFSGSEGYVISYRACKILFDLIEKNKLCLPIDWDLSYFFTNFNIRCFNANIPLCYQGSMVGIYNSSIC